MMGAVKDAVTWASYASEIKYMCEVKGSGHDARLQRLLSASTTAAEGYLANPFDGCDELSPETVPGEVIEGVLLYLQALWVASGQGRAGDHGTFDGQTSKSEQRVAYGAGGFNKSATALAAAQPLWASWRRKVWR